MNVKHENDPLEQQKKIQFILRFTTKILKLKMQLEAKEKPIKSNQFSLPTEIMKYLKLIKNKHVFVLQST